MTKDQVICFLKAPLSLKCFIAYFFVLPAFFIIPFVKDFLSILPVKDGSTLLLLLKTQNFWAGVMGVFLGSGLLYGFCVTLSNKLINDSESPFDLVLPKISISDSIKGFIYNIGRMLYCAIFMVIFIMLISILLMVGFYVSSFLPALVNVLLIIFFLPLTIILFLGLMLYMWIAYMRFLKTWQIDTCFKMSDNYQYFKKYKGRILLVCLIMFVLSQIVSLIIGQIGINLIPGFYPFNAGSIMDIIKLIICFLFGLSCFTYFTLLQAIIQAKAIAWIEYPLSLKR